MISNNMNAKQFGARFGRHVLYIAAAAALATASQTMAYSGYFNSFINPGTGNWSNPANWSYGYVPGQSDEVYFNSNGTLNVDGNYGANEGIFVGTGSGQGGTIDLSAGGSLTTTGDIRLANAAGANGTLNQTGGSIQILNQYGLWVGNAGTGTLNMSGGTATFGQPVIQGTGSAIFIIGAGTGNGTGTVNLSGGTIISYQIAQMGRGTGSTGTLNMTAGALDIAHDFWGGFGTTGGQDTINQSGGTITTGWADNYSNATGASTIDGAFQWGVGNAASTLSVYTLSSTAVLNVNSHLYLGGTGGNNADGSTGGYGEIVMNGGTINIGGADNNAGSLYIGNAAGTASTSSASGTLIVNAGTINMFKTGAILAIGQVATTGGANGTGTLTITGGQVLLPTGTVYIGRADGTNGANGTLNLSGGLLQASSLVWTKASADVSTKAFNWTGGTLDVNSIAADYPTVNNGGTLSPGGAGVATALTFTGADGSYTQSSGALALDLLSNSSADSLNTSGGTVGTVALGGNVNVSSATGYAPAFGATFPLITGKSVTDAASWTLPTLASGLTWDKRITTDGSNSVETLSVVPSSVATNVTSGAWNGGSAGANFKLGGSGGDATISSGVTAGYVQFDSTGSWTVDGAGTLTIAASSGPGGIIAFGGTHDISAPVSFTNGGEIATTVSTANLTIDGSIAGAGTIEKTGLGNLTLTSNSSTFTGNWQLTGGSVNINSDANLGDPSATVILSGGALVAANGWTTSRSISLQGTGGTVNVGNSSTLSGVISGTGGLTKTGAGSLTIANSSNSYTGATTVLSGDLIQGTEYAIPSTSAVVLNTGARFVMNSANASIGSLANAGTGAMDTVLTNGGNLTIGSDNTSTIFNGNIEGNGAGTFTKVGTGTLQINGVAAPSGYLIDTDPGQMINVNGGMLQLNNLSAALSLPGDVNVASGATFGIGSTSGTYGMAVGVHGAGSLQINARGGNVELGGNNDYTGGTNIQTSTSALTIELDDMTEFGPDGTPVTILPNAGATLGAGAVTLQFLSTGTFAHQINLPSQSGYTIYYSGTGSGSSASNPIVITQPVTGLGQIYYSSGTFLVDAQNTNGVTNVHPSGTVVNLGIDNAFSPDYYTLVNGQLNLNGHNLTVGSLIGQSTGIITLSAGNMLTMGEDNTNSQQISSASYGGGYSGILSGAGGITKIGTGDALLTLANPTTTYPAYTGPTVVEAGTLWFNTNAAPVQGTSSFTVDASAMLIFGFGANATISQSITGAGIVQKNNNTYTLTLAGNSNYTGGTNITAGTLAVANNYNLGDPSGAVRFIDAGTAQILQFAPNFDTPNFTRNILLDYETTTNTQYVGTIDTTTNNITLSGTISSLGTGGIAKNGTGTLTVTGNNTFNGNVYVNNGTLSVASVGASGGAPSNLGQPVAGTTIFFGNNQPQPMTTGTLVYTGVGETTDRGISLNGNGDIDNTGSGTLKLTGSVALNPFGLTLDGSGNGELAGAITGSTGVIGVNITNAGTTYNAAPTVAFSGGGATTAAVATAALSGTTVGSVNVTSYGTGYTSAPTVTLNTPSGKTGSGATATAVFSAGSISKQGAGTWTLSGADVIPGTVTVNGGKLQLANNQTYGGLNLQSGSVAMSASPHTPHMLTTSALSIAAGTALDLSDNDLTVNYAGQADPISTIKGYLATGYANGNWNGTGLTTSAAATTPGTTLGYIDNTTNSTVQVKYAWYGDLDLSGTVDNNDLMAMGNIPTSGPNAGAIGWFDGDLNYDGKINQDDWALFQLGLAESKGASISSVPEPSTLALLAAAGMMLNRKRRK